MHMYGGSGEALLDENTKRLSIGWDILVSFSKLQVY